MVSGPNLNTTNNEPYIDQLLRDQAVSNVFRKADANQDGKITQDEFVSAATANGKTDAEDAASQFGQLDMGGKGYLDRSDLELAMRGASGAGGGARTGGGAQAAGGGAARSYEPEDLNQDGRVTAQERIEYALRQYRAQAEQAPSSQGATA